MQPWVLLASIGLGPILEAAVHRVSLPGGIPFEARAVPSGTFLMGSSQAEPGRYIDETLHRVTLTRSYLVQNTEMTQQQWRALMGNEPSAFQGDPMRPVERVSWYDALACANALSRAEGLPEVYDLAGCTGTPGEGDFDCAAAGLVAGHPALAIGWRLPAEAEWEHACRAGTATVWSHGDDARELVGHAWFEDVSGNSSHPVASRQANAWGLHDMMGNVWEWCWDKPLYDPSPAVDPLGSVRPDIVARVYRGGAWGVPARDVRPACRAHDDPAYRSPLIGFRLVRTLPGGSS
ncbi:MAG: formylglycine-generating enzyme family protein [Candidatus Sericytochromatia bacterium]|nr:formylglycine-generating enzyme family protein [Candidatus Sericytochromatia bacterium]